MITKCETRLAAKLCLYFKSCTYIDTTSSYNSHKLISAVILSLFCKVILNRCTSPTAWYMKRPIKLKYLLHSTLYSIYYYFCYSE